MLFCCPATCHFCCPATCHFCCPRHKSFISNCSHTPFPLGRSTIPSEIGLLTQLTYLSLNSNVLTSTIPTEIGLLTQLTLLDVFRKEYIPLDFISNNLTSAIPSETGLVTQLAFWMPSTINQSIWMTPPYS